MANVTDVDRLFGVGEADVVQRLKAPAGVAKMFRAYGPAPSFLLPPSLDALLPDDHTDRFVSEIVDDSMDLTSVYASHTNATGAPPFDLRTLLKLLLYSARRP